jgi:ribonuclease P protein component
MPAKYRVSRAEFKSMRGFKRLSGELFALSWGEIPGRASPGAAVVVSKKVARVARSRNTIKRRARSVLAGALRDLKSPTVFVFIAKKGAGKASFGDVRADIEALIARTRSSR